jgi:hypothetical protein
MTTCAQCGARCEVRRTVDPFYDEVHCPSHGRIGAVSHSEVFGPRCLEVQRQQQEEEMPMQQNQLEKLKRLNGNVSANAEALETLKGEVKSAREDYDAAVDALRDYISDLTDGTKTPLLDAVALDRTTGELLEQQ